MVSLSSILIIFTVGCASMAAPTPDPKPGYNAAWVGRAGCSHFTQWGQKFDPKRFSNNKVYKEYRRCCTVPWIGADPDKGVNCAVKYGVRED
ncbi:hypothetical protein FRB93_002665 [Tulasnella sp. JGI-2019a]|nr:hypothetical protein FRB93_002665 [Tulasnella sp. JGI-2019a]